MIQEPLLNPCKGAECGDECGAETGCVSFFVFPEWLASLVPGFMIHLQEPANTNAAVPFYIMNPGGE